MSKVLTPAEVAVLSRDDQLEYLGTLTDAELAEYKVQIAPALQPSQPQTVDPVAVSAASSAHTIATAAAADAKAEAERAAAAEAAKAGTTRKRRSTLPTPQGRDYNDGYVFPSDAVNAHFAEPDAGHAHRDENGEWQVGAGPK